MDVLKTLRNVVGLTVKVTNTLGEEYTGTVYSYTITPGALVLQIPSQTAVGASYNYKFFRTSQVRALTVVSRQIDESKVAIIASVDPHVLPQIAKRNKETMEANRKTRNPNTTKEGQFIFNSVYKTMPTVSWKGDSIIVLDEVKIDPPYRVNCIKSILTDSTEESDAIKLVKKIVDGVWLKLETERKGG